MQIGFIGAGRLGQALAKRLVAAGHAIMLSNSRGAEAVRDTAERLGCRAGTAKDAAKFGEVVVVSVPLRALPSLPAVTIGRRIVVDTCNYYPERDGLFPDLESGAETTSGLLQKTLPNAVVVKVFNSVLASHLVRGGAVLPGGRRHALPYAADDLAMGNLVAQLVNDAGFDAVFAGPIKESWRFERARPSYCRVLDAHSLRALLETTRRIDFVPEGSWRCCKSIR